VSEQWAPEDTSTPIKPDSRKPAAASRTLDDADRSLAAAGNYSALYIFYFVYVYFSGFIACLRNL